MIKIMLNGKQRELEGPVRIPALLDTLGVKPNQVAVALNGEVVKRDVWPEVSIEEGATVEVVRAVGGG